MKFAIMCIGVGLLTLFAMRQPDLDWYDVSLFIVGGLLADRLVAQRIAWFFEWRLDRRRTRREEAKWRKLREDLRKGGLS